MRSEERGVRGTRRFARGSLTPALSRRERGKERGKRGSAEER